MRRSLTALAVLSMTVVGSPAAVAETPVGAVENVDFLANVPGTNGVVALEFLEYGRGRDALEVMVVSGTFGVKTYDLADPTDPVLLDEIPAEEFALPGDPPPPWNRAFWQNEDMNVDEARKRVFMSRDPRAFDGTTSDPSDVAGFYVVDAADPADLDLVTFHELPTGHTTTCVNDCDFLWTGGPASNVEQRAEWPGGRPVFATDVRDLSNIVTGPTAIDTERFDGVTSYAHDVDVDSSGIAWVSGLGGVRGYHTSGKHTDPRTGVRRVATPFDPIPYAGGTTESTATPSSFMHNSDRPIAGDPIPGAAAYGFRPGSLVLATEEAFGSNTCDGVGVFVIASLEGSYDGEAWASTPADPFRLETVSTWSPAGEDGTDIAAPFCSAHYFERDSNIVAYSWYAQGTRFLDISNPADPIQVAYFRPDDSVSYAPFFHGDHVYIADIARGIDIVRIDEGATAASNRRAPVEAPPMSAAARANVAALSARFSADPDYGYLCLLPTAG